MVGEVHHLLIDIQPIIREDPAHFYSLFQTAIHKSSEAF